MNAILNGRLRWWRRRLVLAWLEWRRRKPHDYDHWDHCHACYATFERVNNARPL